MSMEEIKDSGQSLMEFYWKSETKSCNKKISTTIETRHITYVCWVVTFDLNQSDLLPPGPSETEGLGEQSTPPSPILAGKETKPPS